MSQGTAEGNLPESDHFQLQALAEGVYAAVAKPDGGAVCNAGIVDLGDSTLVYDTFISPSAAEDLRAAAEELTDREVDYVVDSHWHNDHIRGNQTFDPETVILATRETKVLIGEREPEVIREEKEEVPASLERVRGMLEEADDPRLRADMEFMVTYLETILRSLPTLQTRLPDRTFAGHMILRGPHRKVELLEFPGGHTDSDTVLHLPEEGIAYVGDLLFIGCHPYLLDGSPSALVEALREVEALEPKVVVPGHGPVGGAGDLPLLRRYVRDLRQLVEDGLRAGVPKADVAKTPIPEPFASWILGGFFQQNLQFLFERGAESD